MHGPFVARSLSRYSHTTHYCLRRSNFGKPTGMRRLLGALATPPTSPPQSSAIESTSPSSTTTTNTSTTTTTKTTTTSSTTTPRVSSSARMNMVTSRPSSSSSGHSSTSYFQSASLLPGTLVALETPPIALEMTSNNTFSHSRSSDKQKYFQPPTQSSAVLGISSAVVQTAKRRGEEAHFADLSAESPPRAGAPSGIDSAQWSDGEDENAKHSSTTSGSMIMRRTTDGTLSVNGNTVGNSSSSAAAGASSVVDVKDEANMNRSKSDNSLSSTKDLHKGSTRESQLEHVLSQPQIDVQALRKLAWSGIPPRLRPRVWRLLLAYEPAAQSRADTVLLRKRREYAQAVSQFWDVDDAVRTPEELALKHQIMIDMPRTCPNLKLFRSELVQLAVARVLYVWSIRHPASGYVQGINDLATPFLAVFLAERVAAAGTAPEPVADSVLQCDFIELLEQTAASLPAADAAPSAVAVPAGGENRSSDPAQPTGKSSERSGSSDQALQLLTAIESDVYWCLTGLLDGIQDNYTFAQKGIQRMIHTLEHSVVRKVDEQLAAHLEAMDIPFIQFAFRWMNCLLLREMPLPLAIRLWDTYFAETSDIATFHVYVCAAFLEQFAPLLKAMDFQELMLFLQKPQTDAWTESELRLVISQAYMWLNQLEPRSQ